MFRFSGLETLRKEEEENKLPWDSKNMQEGEREPLSEKGQENVAQRAAQLGQEQPGWSIDISKQ